MERLVKELADKDLGFSVVVSGLFENVFDICDRVGILPNSVNMSMETIGRTELLPEDRILEIMMR